MPSGADGSPLVGTEGAAAANRRLLAVHGLPLGPRTWERVGYEAIAWRGLATAEPRDDWSLDSFVEELAPRLGPDVVLVGHDLGGVVAAMAALDHPVAAVVLTGTALGPYWAAVRATTAAPLKGFFYEKHAGRRFLAGGVGPASRDAFSATMEPELSAIPDLPARMLAMARAMRPPARLGQRLAARVPVHLVWGRRDAWYPPAVAQAVSRATGAPIHWVDAGHYAMWEAPDAYLAAVHRALR